MTKQQSRRNMDSPSRSCPEEEEEIIFTSKLPPIRIPDHLPIHSYCFQNAHRYPSNPCIIDAASDRLYTYAHVHLLARRTAAGLRRHGITRGHVIMLLLPNSPEFVFAFLAASFLGATATTANPAFTPAEVRRQVAASGACLAITDSAAAAKVRGLAEIRVVCVDEPVPDGCTSFSELASAAEDEESLPESDGGGVAPDEVVALPYSSGTTGVAKGVMVTQRSLVASVAQQLDGENPNIYFRGDDVILCVLPLFHIYSLNSVLLCGLRAGAAVVLMRRFGVAAVAEVVDKYGVTVLPVVPPMVVDMVKGGAAAGEQQERNLSSVRLVMSGAAAMGRELEEKLRAMIPTAKFGQGYGMTEAGVVAMSLAFAKEPFPIKFGACGTVVRNAELKIIDLDTGASLPRNRAGEICIRGAQIMKGYLNDAKATEETLDKEGWLHTGDVGYVDDDDEIFIVDRLKEIIKYNGYQVAPAELEALLIAHPNITDAAVVPMKVERSGELPVAFVKRSDGSEITEDEIKQYISNQVVFYKRIHKVFFTGSIPKSPSGKILRKELRAKLAASVPPM